MREDYDELLAGPPWVRYRALVDLVGLGPDAPDAQAARRAMEDAPELAPLLAEVGAWPGTVLASHKSASQGFHSLSFLAELGVSAGHPAVASAIRAILGGMRDDGMPRLPSAYDGRFGGPGEPRAAWALCDAPVTLKSLALFGLSGHEKVRAGAATVLSFVRANGWPCALSPELASFRPPGRKADPCPYATLVSLELIAALEEGGFAEYSGLKEGPEAAAGVEALLLAWERSRDWHPYMFYAGTDFRKLKAPCLWYDILHVADALSHFPRALGDPRFTELLGAIEAKADGAGRFIPESVYKPYAAWDFGQKKRASPWLGFLVARIRKRREIYSVADPLPRA